MEVNGRKITRDERGRIVYVDTGRPVHPLALQLAGFGARSKKVKGREEAVQVNQGCKSLPEQRKPGPKQVGVRRFK